MRATRHVLKRITIASFLALAIPTAYAAGPADNPGDGAPPPPADMANCPPPPPPGGPGALEEGPMPPFLHGLDLTEAQRDRIFEILHAQAPLMRQKAKEARTAHEALRDLAMSAQYDDGRARALSAEDAKASADLALTRVRSEHEIFALLTPEQRKAVQETKVRLEEGRGPDRKAPPPPPNS